MEDKKILPTIVPVPGPTTAIPIRPPPPPPSSSSQSAAAAAAAMTMLDKIQIPTRPVAMGVAIGGREIPIPRPLPSSTLTSAEAAAPPVLVQEYSLRVPKTNVRPVSIMRFNQALGVDPSQWTSVRMAREDNSRLHKTTVIVPDEEMPKFGAGSEYGREAREEARRRKYGLNKKKYNPEDQPWLLKLGDKINRKYRGVREGGVSENASYCIFTQAADGAFEVFPINHWYNFTPIQRYKSLNSEEAELEFGRRNKIMNYFSVMVRRRMRNEDVDGEEEPVPGTSSGKKRGKKATSDLKVSEMEDWADSDDEEMSDEGEDADEKPKDKKKAGGKGKKAPPKKKKKGSDDDEGLEDSDDGDEEGRELDYISDTSGSGVESEPEKEGDIKGVDQEDAMRDLLESGSDSEEEGKNDKNASDEVEDEAGPSSAKNEEQSEPTDKKKKKKKKKKSPEKKETENLSEDGDKSDNADDKMDLGAESSLGVKGVKVEPGSEKGSGNSRDGNVGDGEGGSFSGKRKASSELLNMATFSTKKPKMEVSSTLLQSAAAEGITEEAVRRYLLRKPMTVTELLQKFKSKKTKISSQDMVNVIANILKKINPVKRMQNQKMYLYLTAPKP